MDKCYRVHEKEKKRQYEARIREVDHATFTPLVFSVYGGMAPECSVFYKRVASLVAEKNKDTYIGCLSWIRCSLLFVITFCHSMP